MNDRVIMVDFCGSGRCPFRYIPRCKHEEIRCLLSDEIDFRTEQPMLPEKCPLRSQSIVVRHESIHSKNNFAELLKNARS
jgi:hypothetical protein